MENFFNNITTILIMNGSILLIPGVNFFLIARYSLLNEFLTGFYCVMGITSAIMLHATLSMFSVSLLLKSYPQLFTIIRYSGGAYLFYLGTRLLVASSKKKHTSLESLSTKIHKTEAFYSGFFVDLFNPFVSIFYLSLFSMLMPNGKSVFELSCYLGTIFIITVSWFCIVVCFFIYSPVKAYFQDKSKYILVFSGIAMYYFCSKVILEF